MRGKNKFVDFKDMVLKEYEKGNVVILNIDGIATIPLKEIIKQPASGILYDLNRSEEVVLTFIKDEKWVNDYPVAKIIRELKKQLELKSKENE